VPDTPTRLSEALADRYRLERELGAGGMATVYLAEDMRHQRRVAIKVLRPELAAVLGAERFVQEITTTAQLQHPHILPLFDSGQADGFLYYVMPYIEGETLRDKLTREKQLGIEEAIKITTEVADALDYAHRHGVIHRDIKPENILLHDGRPMVADFGIALAVSAAAGGRMTETGLSLGTPHYMSPEQATAEKEITARSDVYSLASVLYEMLAGQPPHLGGSAQQIIMKIVTDQARPVTELRKAVPANVAAALSKALEKLPADRFDSARAFAEALGNAAFATAGGTTAAPAALRAAAGWRGRLHDPLTLVLALTTLAAVVAAGILARRTPAAAVVPPIRFIVASTDSTRPVLNFPWPATISPDGSTVVYAVATSATTGMLYVLRTDQLEARPIPGTTNAAQPYFSPDGRWLAFEQEGKERKVKLDGSAPVTIATAGAANGSDWLPGEQIVLGAYGPNHGLSHVNAAGGQPVAFTRPDTANGKTDHLWPIGLPDGRRIVFVIWSGSLTTSELAMTSLDDGEVAPLGILGIRPLAVLDGMLVYLQADGTMMAVKLDARRRRIDGSPIPVHDPIRVEPANNGNSSAFLSRGGALVTARGGTRGKLVWISPGGRVEPLMAQARGFELPRLSPDERRVAVVVHDDQRSDVWIYDRVLSTFSRLTTAETVTSVDWSADGSHILFTASGEGARGAVWWQLAAGGSPAERLFQNTYLSPLVAMSPDSKSLLVTSLRETSWDILRVPLDSGAEARAYLATDAIEGGARFSPGGRWVALTSTESGREEIYVRSFPDPSFKVQVSVTGGNEPSWSADGRRLYYRSGTALMVAEVSLAPSFTLLRRDTLLSNARMTTGSFFGSNYAVSRDGKRVLVIMSDSDDFQIVVSPNWITEFRQRVAESGVRR
jgi:Tol biopolymer transport system component/tRNA A-37 threonylcarbamoyl transferase component Bud32